MKIFKILVLFLTGGNLYYLIEILWRGYSHIGMLILGGLCFLLIGSLNECYFKYKRRPILLQLLVACLIITVLEFIFGLILNVWLGLNIWDYSHLEYNFMGQICLRYSLKWFFLALPAIMLDDYLRYWLFGEEKPSYRVV